LISALPSSGLWSRHAKLIWLNWSQREFRKPPKMCTHCYE
jgi:hypothetical protein